MIALHQRVAWTFTPGLGCTTQRVKGRGQVNATGREEQLNLTVGTYLIISAEFFKMIMSG